MKLIKQIQEKMGYFRYLDRTRLTTSAIATPLADPIVKSFYADQLMKPDRK
jgi:hypothetical protein